MQTVKTSNKPETENVTNQLIKLKMVINNTRGLGLFLYSIKMIIFFDEFRVSFKVFTARGFSLLFDENFDK